MIAWMMVSKTSLQQPLFVISWLFLTIFIYIGHKYVEGPLYENLNDAVDSDSLRFWVSCFVHWASCSVMIE